MTCARPEVPEELEYVYRTDACVRAVFNAGGSLCDCIRTLVGVKDEYRKQVLELKAIAPIKVRQSDGAVAVWHCPDDLVPLSGDSGLEAAERLRSSDEVLPN